VGSRALAGGGAGWGAASWDAAVVGGLDAAEDGGDLALELGEVEIDDGAAGMQDYVDGCGEQGERCTDGFTETPLDAIAIDRFPEGFGNRQADARPCGS